MDEDEDRRAELRRAVGALSVLADGPQEEVIASFFSDRGGCDLAARLRGRISLLCDQWEGHPEYRVYCYVLMYVGEGEVALVQGSTGTEHSLVILTHPEAVRVGLAAHDKES